MIVDGTGNQKNGGLAVPIFLMYTREGSAPWRFCHPIGPEATGAHANPLGLSINQYPHPL
jgi:hypothetical protein